MIFDALSDKNNKNSICDIIRILKRVNLKYDKLSFLSIMQNKIIQ